MLAGAALITVLGVSTWAMAAYLSGGDTETSDRLAPTELEIGPVEAIADEVAENGPLFFPELSTSVGSRSIVVDHTGEVDADGWRVYWAYPADRDSSCIVTQVEGTREFTDCDDRTVDVSELSPPDEGVFPRVDDRTTLFIDLRAATADD